MSKVLIKEKYLQVQRRSWILELASPEVGLQNLLRYCLLKIPRYANIQLLLVDVARGGLELYWC